VSWRSSYRLRRGCSKSRHDTAYRSRANGAWSKAMGLTHLDHRHRPRREEGQPRRSSSRWKPVALVFRSAHIPMIPIAAASTNMTAPPVSMTLARESTNVSSSVSHIQNMSEIAGARKAIRPSHTSRRWRHTPRPFRCTGHHDASSDALTFIFMPSAPPLPV
jgi:hypothetical protein